MRAVDFNTGLPSVTRLYRNRPNPRTSAPAPAETLRDGIYFVGDDPCLYDQIATGFSAAGSRVLGFFSAREYLEFSAKDAAACVVIDNNLPDMSGLELQRRLAATSHSPIVFISSSGDVPLTVCAMKAGAIDVFCKPLDFSALMTAILAGLEHDRKLRQRKAELAKLQVRLQSLTPREREVLPLVIGGLLNKQAAGLLGISEVTLQIHRSQVMRKMQASSLADLVRMAMKLRVSHWREEPGRVQ